MQLSAANLLIASQQIARGVQQSSPDEQARFAAALAEEKSISRAPTFEPLQFRPATPEQHGAPAAPAATTDRHRSGPLGASLDISV